MSEEFFEEGPAWYAVYTKPMAESRVESNLRAWQLETFAPKIKVRRDNEFTGRPVYVTRPLFPRYAFARFKLSGLMHKVIFTRGVQNIVSFGGRPSIIDDQIVEFIKSQVDGQGYVRMDALRPGDRVVIKGGPFKDLVGIFDSSLRDHERVSILLTAVSFQNRIIVERDLVTRADGLVA
jgi:transcriptional antiterminator RfaH